MYHSLAENTQFGQFKESLIKGLLVKAWAEGGES